MSDIRVYEVADANRAALEGKRIAVIGYGSQGHAHALNLKDSGHSVVVGLYDGSSSAARAREAGLEVKSVAEAAAEADLIALLIPDTKQATIYNEAIVPNLKAGDTLLFAHGFNIHYDEINPPANIDVILVAPKSPGDMVRREYQGGRGVPALAAVHQDASGKAFETALAYAEALGCARAGVLETTFKDETETDLFGEQAVLCGGFSELVMAGFETLVDAGYKPELAYFECLHELKLIVDLAYAKGISGMRAEISDTAEYGDYVSGPRVIGSESRQAMKDVLVDIQSGDFARRWIKEARGDRSEFEAFREAGKTHAIESVGEDLRTRMSWL